MVLIGVLNFPGKKSPRKSEGGSVFCFLQNLTVSCFLFLLHGHNRPRVSELPARVLSVCVAAGSVR